MSIGDSGICTIGPTGEVNGWMVTVSDHVDGTVGAAGGTTGEADGGTTGKTEGGATGETEGGTTGVEGETTGEAGVDRESGGEGEK